MSYVARMKVTEGEYFSASGAKEFGFLIEETHSTDSAVIQRALRPDLSPARWMRCDVLTCQATWLVNDALHGLGLLQQLERTGDIRLIGGSPADGCLEFPLASVPFAARREQGTTVIELLASDPCGRFLAGNYTYGRNAFFPESVRASSGDVSLSMDLLSLQVSAPSSQPSVSQPWVAPPVPPRPEGLAMFKGEDKDFLQRGFTPRQALDHLAQSTEGGQALDGGCVVEFSVTFVEAPGMLQVLPVPDSQMTWAVKRRDGSVVGFAFDWQTSIAGGGFSTVQATGVIPDHPLAVDCAIVLQSPASLDASDFIQHVDALGITLNEFGFLWWAAQARMKEQLDGVCHFHFLFLPEGRTLSSPGTFSPRRAAMDCDFALWEQIALPAAVVRGLDA